MESYLTCDAEALIASAGESLGRENVRFPLTRSTEKGIEGLLTRPEIAMAPMETKLFSPENGSESSFFLAIRVGFLTSGGS